MWNSKGESDFYLHTSFFKVVLPADFNQTIPVRCQRSSTSSQQGITFLHGLQTHLTYLFLPSSPLSSCGTSLPRLAPSLLLHAGTALLSSKGLGELPVLVPMPSHSQPHSPGYCSVLHTSLSGCSYSWYQLELGQVTV